ncbi:MAG: hypothetical protein QOG27_1001, partial [Verrucomicrobiota bacterium]
MAGVVLTLLTPVSGRAADGFRDIYGPQ